jgi:hypothetical protein
MLGKMVIGYRGDFRLASDNEGSIINLQAARSVNRRFPIARNLDELEQILRTIMEDEAIPF